MTEHTPRKSTCRNCFRKFANTTEILQGADGTWVHTFLNGMHYPIKCNPWEEWKAEPND
jgi:hypothetical protein